MILKIKYITTARACCIHIYCTCFHDYFVRNLIDFILCDKRHFCDDVLIH